MTIIALVDDEPNILKALKRALHRHFPNILTFDNPETALSELTYTNVDLIISDYKMPQMTGVEFLAQFKQSHPDSIRMILSGQADMQGVLDAINNVGIYRFLLKPWNDDELIVNIQKALAYNKLEQENKELLRTVKDQSIIMNSQLSELKRLERDSPGITQIDLNEDGCIDLSGEYLDDIE
tara:strand:+ start:17093 stop:17635 length:543 start_codon:yes stop_codon:yes gene_type:complete